MNKLLNYLPLKLHLPMRFFFVFHYAVTNFLLKMGTLKQRYDNCG